MTMKHLTVVSMLCVLVVIQSVGGLNIEPRFPGGKCKCFKTTMHFIPPKTYKQIEIYPQGPNCPETEIIITMKNDNLVCVNPEAKWMKRFIDFLKEQKRINGKSADFVTKNHATRTGNGIA
ncbi:C-X-C motif chemokine 13 [Discoglossus pictus]